MKPISASIEIDLGHEKTFNRLILQEYIPLGQRVKVFSVDYWDGGAWQQKIEAIATVEPNQCVTFGEIGVISKRFYFNCENFCARRM